MLSFHKGLHVITTTCSDRTINLFFSCFEKVTSSPFNLYNHKIPKLRFHHRNLEFPRIFVKDIHNGKCVSTLRYIKCFPKVYCKVNIFLEIVPLHLWLFQVEFLFVVLLEKHTESFQQLIMSRSVNISWGGADTGFVKQKFEEIVRLTKSLIFWCSANVKCCNN